MDHRLHGIRRGRASEACRPPLLQRAQPPEARASSGRAVDAAIGHAPRARKGVFLEPERGWQLLWLGEACTDGVVPAQAEVAAHVGVARPRRLRRPRLCREDRSLKVHSLHQRWLARRGTVPQAREARAAEVGAVGAPRPRRRHVVRLPRSDPALVAVAAQLWKRHRQCLLEARRANDRPLGSEHSVNDAGRRGVGKELNIADVALDSHNFADHGGHRQVVRVRARARARVRARASLARTSRCRHAADARAPDGDCHADRNRILVGVDGGGAAAAVCVCDAGPLAAR